MTISSQRRERIAQVETLAIQRWLEALRDDEPNKARNYALSAGIAFDKAQLLEGLPTEILGGLPEYQGSLLNILAKVERVHGAPLALRSPSTSTSTPTTSNASSREPLDTSPPNFATTNPLGATLRYDLTVSSPLTERKTDKKEQESIVQNSSESASQEPKDLQVAHLSGQQPVRRRYKGRKDAWPGQSAETWLKPMDNNPTITGT